MKTNRTGKWVFPDFPTSDTSLPQITIKYDTVDYDNDSAADFCSEGYDIVDGVYKEYFYRKATTKVQFYVLTNKIDEWVVEIDGIQRKFTNKLFNIYLSNQLKTLLLKTRGDAFSLFDELNIENIEYSFESNKYTWATQITCNLEFKDLWTNEYVNGELIASYSLLQNVN